MGGLYIDINIGLYTGTLEERMELRQDVCIYCMLFVQKVHTKAQYASQLSLLKSLWLHSHILLSNSPLNWRHFLRDHF